MSEDNEKYITIEMYDWSCASCGVNMSMPKSHNSSLRETHNTFYCLNGHKNVYPHKTNIEDVQDKLANEYAKNAQLEDRIKKLEKSFINRIIPPK